jgi:hypothetical protein
LDLIFIFIFTWHPSDLLAFRIAPNALGCQVEIPTKTRTFGNYRS